MREPPSPALLVARIGILFGADGVTGGTKIEDEVAGYANSEDRAALQKAIEYERRHCRPWDLSNNLAAGTGTPGTTHLAL